ncbi:35288_t:CDS:2, partial [Gigaspora margarita]
MPLSIFVGFNRHRQNILLTQALLSDESTDSYIWMFEEILKVTKRQLAVMITDADPAVDSAHLRNSLGNDYSKFTEEFYSCKNSLAKETFEKKFKDICQNFPSAKLYMELLDLQDKKVEYNVWKLAIPCIKSQEKTNFLFKKVDECLERILMPNILQRQRDEINQSIYYEAIKSLDNDIEGSCNDEQEIEICDTSAIKAQQILLNELIYLVGGLSNVIEVWSVKVANKFYNEEQLIEETASSIMYLGLFSQNNQDVIEESLNLIQQRKVYGELHKFMKEIDKSSEDLSEEKDSQPAGTKWLKSASEQKITKNQRYCKKC